MRLRTLILFCLAVGLAAAAGLDGTWTSEMKMRGKKGGGEQTVTITLNLKADGGNVTGSVSSPGKKRSGTSQIQDGKIDGNSFSFTTVQKSKKGEQKQVWKGTIDGDTMQGTRSREGGKRGQPFTAKRG